MEDRLASARDAVEKASELTDDSNVREQLDSIERGLDSLSGEAAPDDDAEEGDRLEEVERQLVELGDETDDLAAEHVQTARDRIDEFRRDRARDWEG